jgi:hypothetical protein
VAERWRLKELYEDFCCNEAAHVKFKIVVQWKDTQPIYTFPIVQNISGRVSQMFISDNRRNCQE